MTEEEIEQLKQTVEYFGHWYDIIGEKRVSILEKAVKEIEQHKAQIEKSKGVIQSLYYCLKNYDKIVLGGELCKALVSAEQFVKNN